MDERNERNERTERPAGRDRNSFQERRRQSDWVVNAASILSLIAWLVAITAVIVIDTAAPEWMNFNVRGLSSTAGTEWNATLLWSAFILLILSVCSCITAFIFNMMRMRRKTDKYRKSILIIGAATLVGLVYFTLRFGPNMFI
ncbi:MAG: hypothetical protein LBI27_09665 [Clostridiales bacterium]|jgi:putative copper export protein|nr:hypothetical protein [Clostridiales bacterium]